MSKRISKHEQCYDANADIENIFKCVKDGHPLMVIMRGVSGSGKTTFAKELCKMTDSSFAIHSYDNYTNGQILRFADNEEEYHTKNIKEAKKSLQNGVSLIIIDADNIKENVVRSYVTQAVNYIYEFYLVEPTTEWRLTSYECARKSPRNETVEKIEESLIEFQNNRILKMESLVGKGREIVLNSFDYDVDSYTYSSPVYPSLSSSSKGSSADGCYFISLSLPSAAILETREIGTVVNFTDIALFMADLDDLGIVEPMGISSKKREKIPEIRVLDREICARPEFKYLQRNTQEVKLAYLVGMFGSQHPRDLAHYYEIFGYTKTFKMFLEFYGLQDNFEPFFLCDDHLISSEMYCCSVTVKITSDEEDYECHVRKYEEMIRSDAELARLLQDESAEEEQGNIPVGKKTMAQKLQLSNLYQKYPGFEKKDVEYYFEINNRNTEFTIRFINSVFGDISIASSSSNVKKPLKFERPSRAREKRLEMELDMNLMSAQRYAMKLHEEKRKCLIELLNIGGRRGGYYQPIINATQRQKVSERIKEYEKRIDDVIVLGNMRDNKIKRAKNGRRRYRIDLHYMTVNGACDFVATFLRDAPKHSTIEIVTGIGNNSENNDSRIRQKCRQLLHSNDYKFNNPLNNDGCFIVKL